MRRQLQGTLLHFLRKNGRLGNVINQAPIFGLLAAHTFNTGAEQISQVVAHMALVGHAGQAASTGQHTEQGHFRQTDGRSAVIDQDDFVAGQGQFVAATGASTVDGC